MPPLSLMDVPRVSAEEALRLIGDGYQYIDVRSDIEFGTGHPVGAHNIPLSQAGAAGLEPNALFMAAMEALYDKSDKLLIGCQVGKRSLAAARLLIEAGYDNVIDMRPGMSGQKNAFGQVTEKGWLALGYPTELETDGGSWRERRAAAGL